MATEYDPYMGRIGTTPDGAAIWGYVCQDCGAPCDADLICETCVRRRRYYAGETARDGDNACVACGVATRQAFLCARCAALEMAQEDLDELRQTYATLNADHTRLNALIGRVLDGWKDLEGTDDPAVNAFIEGEAAQAFIALMEEFDDQTDPYGEKAGAAAEARAER